MIARKFFYTILTFVVCAQAGTWDWQTLTSARGVRQIFAADTSVWCATDGGALRYDVDSGRFAHFLNTDGLAGNDVLTVEKDRHGRVWVAISDGTLNILDPHDNTWSAKKDYIGHIIHDLYAYGDSIFVSLDIGVSLYDAGRWEVKETYKIGETRRTTIIDGDIWAAGKTALRRANLDFPNLMAPSAWTVYTVDNGLQDNYTSAVCASEGLIFIATQSGVSIFDGSNWLPAELQGVEIRDLAVWQNHMIALGYNGVYMRKATATWEKLGGGVWTGQSLAVDGHDVIWVGMQKNGLLYYQATDKTWHEVIPDGPGDNKFTALAFDRNGNLWTASSSAGVSCFNGEKWIHFNMASGAVATNLFMDLTVDVKNRVWASSWGSGVYIFTAAGDSFQIEHISSHNGLRGIEIDPNYVVVPKVQADESGNVWILNYEAANLQVLAVVDTAYNWQYFSTLDGIKSRLVTTLAIDRAGRKWIGTQDMGVSVLDDGGTPFSKSDDDLTQGLGSEDGLTDLNVRTIAYDRDGVMWIGTPEGLFYWFDGQVKPRYSLINDNINRLAVDVRNNKWIGTVGGLTLMDADGFTMQHFSTSNSPLVNDYITCFAFDENTGITYIGTTNGLSRLQTPYSKPAQDLSQLRGYPNPFVLLGTNSYFHIENLVQGASVHIFTPEGKLVRKIASSQIFGSRVDWDGRNNHGEWVASGIYLYLATTETGLSKVGKVAVVRP
ncbi:hypothetical protein JXO59_03890 [candidate division KSB1 bacterium]|nr:hypothetical protein [candidate division KSB1 bacterium]